MLQVKHTTVTLAFESPRLHSLPSTPTRPWTAGAFSPGASSAARTGAATTNASAMASTPAKRRIMSKLLKGKTGTTGALSRRLTAKELPLYEPHFGWFAASFQEARITAHASKTTQAKSAGSSHAQAGKVSSSGPSIRRILDLPTAKST